MTGALVVSAGLLRELKSGEMAAMDRRRSRPPIRRGKNTYHGSIIALKIEERKGRW